jgi:hypothetical protein
MSTKTEKINLKIETAQRGGALAPLFGEFVRAGKMNVSGEETIGCAIAMTEEALRSAPRLPFYRRVAVLAVDDYAVLEEMVAETLANRHGYTVLGEPAMIYRGDAAAVLAALGLSPNIEGEPRAKRVALPPRSGRLLKNPRKQNLFRGSDVCNPLILAKTGRLSKTDLI